MEKEIELLSRLAANHLHLGQFEPLRATLLALRVRNPDLALAILQTIVAKAGQFNDVIWSPSCPSPSLLTYLSLLELLDFNNSASAWGFDPSMLQLRVEFLLIVQMLIDRASNKIGKGSDQSVSINEGLGDLSGELGKCVGILGRILELGVNRLSPEVGEGDQASSRIVAVEEEELSCLTGMVRDESDVFDSLCFNVHLQVRDRQGFDPSLAITTAGKDDGGGVDLLEVEEHNVKVMKLIQRRVQLAHLEAMKECLKEEDEEGAILHIRYLHLDCGVEEMEYRMVLEDLLKKLMLKRKNHDEIWISTQKMLLQVYGEALSSKWGQHVEMIQVIHDKLFFEEIETYRALSNQIPPPIECFQRYIIDLETDSESKSKTSLMKMAIYSCMRDMYHYARVLGLHMLECVMDTALSAVRREQLQEASNALQLFPRLQPLVAVMGWDLLSGKTAARRKLMQFLWTSKSQVYRLEESSLYGNQSDERPCVEHLCDMLCYHLDLASFVAHVNSGKKWDQKCSLLLSAEAQAADGNEVAPLDSFVENFILERLSVQSPLRVLFDVVPGISFQEALELISMQPIASTAAAWKRMQDIELMRMRYAMESTVFALGEIDKSMSDDGERHYRIALGYLKDLRNHLEAVKNIPRKIMMVNIIISLLHMDSISLNSTHCASLGSYSDSQCTYAWDDDDLPTWEGGNSIVISFTSLLLEILRSNISSTMSDQEHAQNGGLSTGGRQALEWRFSMAKQFVEDWDWRLSILQRLLPLSEHQWKWKEALAVLCAAPSKLLNLCMQRAKYDIGSEAVHRFLLSAEDKATLELIERIDKAVGRASVQSKSVEEADSQASDGTSAIKDVDFSSLRSQLGPLPAVLLCIDISATAASSSKMSQELLNQAQVMLSEIYPGDTPKRGSTYWDQIHEVGIISVARRVLKRLHEFLDQDNPPALPDLLSGHIYVISSKDTHRQGQRERALAMLHQMIEDAHKGKRQFLSGKLHNLARAVADEEAEHKSIQIEGPYADWRYLSNIDKDGVFGLGLKAARQSPLTNGEKNVQHVSYDMNDTGKKLFGPLSSKATSFLSQFILHIAAIGDIVDGTDTTHDFNFFSIVYEWPKDLLTRLVFDRGSSDAAGKLAEIMHADFVHEVISSCVPPVLPPRSGHGWACIPVIPTCPESSSENKVLSPSSRISKPSSYIRSSAPGVPLYPLQLDIVRHLVKLSPVRAVLACVFGSSILYSGTESAISSSVDSKLLQASDADRLFYEFALDQSERYPTLNRWIQMQTNLHRVLEFAEINKSADDDKAKSDARSALKRLREHCSDSESDVDDVSGTTNIFSPLPDHHDQGVSASPNAWRNSTKFERAEPQTTVLLSFDWENEEPYEKAVERLIDEGKLVDALALSDRFLRNGASDHLLQLLIESGEESHTWQYCLRLKDKKLAAELALKYLRRWKLDAALDVLTMCSCHLPVSDPLRNEVVQMRQALLRYSHILSADDHFSSWQEVEAECKQDPEGLALRLAGKGAVSAALEVAESAGLSIDLRRELQGRQLVKLLTADPLSGGGPAEASRFLSSLRGSDDALPVAMGAMQLLPNLRSKQLLVHFFLKRRDGNLSDPEVSRLNSWALGLRVLAALPLPWQKICSSLHEHPHLILEVLLMRKQLQSASLILKEFPSLRDNNLVISYAAKAISISISSPSRQARISISGSKPRQKAKVSTPTRSSFTASLSNLQKEARRAFSWTSRNTVEKAASKDSHRKRKSSGLAAPERAAWEAMAGIQEDHAISHSPDVLERVPPVSIAEEWMLTGDAIKDGAVRATHRYESAPDVILFKALLGLCSDELVSAKSALDLCVNQMKNVLSSQQLPENASLETIGRAYYATEAFVQGLVYAKSLFRKLVGNSEVSSTPEKSRDADDVFSDAGSSSVGSQSTDELSQYLTQTDSWLGRAEVLQSLLGSGISVSLDDIADKESSAGLRDRLIVDERYSMAVYTCKKCKIDVFPVWNAWGHALLRMERYAQARVKFKQALQLYKKDDTASVIQEIINTIEGGPPVDVSAVRSMYEHLAKSAPTILDDSLSADSYLNVLHMPSTFPRSERSRRSDESRNNNATIGSEFDDEPRSNLDSVRYTECVNYLQDYARKQLLNFMFRHGHYKDACLLFFPPNAVPSPPQPSATGVVTSSSSPQRPDPLATDYGTIDELCDLCIGYSAMPVLEEVISSRILSENPEDSAVNQYTTAALGRICHYCESHKHFNYLYKFQVIKKDHVAAGLCCIQLFMNSSCQEEALKHLEHAKTHFEEALSARHKGVESTKLLKKGLRGKSASEKLTEEGLVKFSSRLAIQMDIVRSFNDSEGPQWKHSLFGNPNDPDTFRRRCEIAETLVERNFDLAFQVICEFNLPAVDIYAGVAASLADRKKGSQLTEFFKNIKGTINDDDWDQVLGAAINVYANKHKERPDRLIDMLTSSHRKVLACVVCGRLKSAFQIASRSGSVADVQYVAHQALHANALPVLDMCKQWLAQYM